jgi:hypothetical protein
MAFRFPAMPMKTYWSPLAESAGCNGSEIEQETQPMTPQAHKTTHELRPSNLTPLSPVLGTPKLTEVFNLDEGQVTLSVPAMLSPESYQDMADRMEIFLRGLKRRSDAEAARRHVDREDVPRMKEAAN